MDRQQRRDLASIDDNGAIHGAQVDASVDHRERIDHHPVNALESAGESAGERAIEIAQTR